MAKDHYDCPEMMGLLTDFLDGDISDDDEVTLRKHLDGCPPCLSFMDSYEKTGDLCKQAIEREMPKEMEACLLSFLRSKCQGGCEEGGDS